MSYPMEWTQCSKLTMEDFRPILRKARYGIHDNQRRTMESLVVECGR